MYIVVSRVSPDGLNVKKWSFLYFEHLHALVLNSFEDVFKPSKRHKNFTSGRVYARLSHERIDGQFTRLMLADVEIPEDVIQRARNEFCHKLQILRDLPR